MRMKWKGYFIASYFCFLFFSKKLSLIASINIFFVVTGVMTIL